MIVERMSKLKKYIQAVVFTGLVVCVCACGSKYNSIDQKDPNAGSEHVYGNIGGPPLQAGSEHPADPDAGARAAAIREKMFGDTQGAEPGLQQGNPGQ